MDMKHNRKILNNLYTKTILLNVGHYHKEVSVYHPNKLNRTSISHIPI